MHCGTPLANPGNDVVRGEVPSGEGQVAEFNVAPTAAACGSTPLEGSEDVVVERSGTDVDVELCDPDRPARRAPKMDATMATTTTAATIWVTRLRRCVATALAARAFSRASCR